MLDLLRYGPLLDLLMSGRLGGIGETTATPGFGGPLPAQMPETVLDPIRPRPTGWQAVGSRYQGLDIPQDEARRARGGALADAGLAILSGAGSGNFAESLTRGLGAFRGGLDRGLSSYVERQRQQEQDERARLAAEEALASSRQGREESAAREVRTETVFGQEQEGRTNKAGAARQLAAEIERVAGPDSEDARRARALLRAQPELFSELEELHGKVVDRSRFGETEAMKTDAEIKKRQRLYAEDPEAVFNRRMEERRTGAYERSIEGYGTGGRRPTPQQFNDDVRSEANSIYDVLKDEAKEEQEAWYDANPGAGYGEAPKIDFMALRDRAEQLARQRVQQRYTSPGTVGEGPSDGQDERELDRLMLTLSPAEQELVRKARTQGRSAAEILEAIRR